MSTTPSPLDRLLASAASASSGVSNALVQARDNAPSNALAEQMTILSLPYGESIFPEEEELTRPTPDPAMPTYAPIYPSDGSGGGTVVSAPPVYLDDGTALLSPLGSTCPPLLDEPAFSIFGLGTGASVAVLGLGLLALLGGGDKHKR